MNVPYLVLSSRCIFIIPCALINNHLPSFYPDTLLIIDKLDISDNFPPEIFDTHSKLTKNNKP